MQFDRVEVLFSHVKGAQDLSSGGVSLETIDPNGSQSSAEGRAFSEVFRGDKVLVTGSAVSIDAVGQDCPGQEKARSFLGLPDQGKDETVLRVPNSMEWSDRSVSQVSGDPRVSDKGRLVERDEIEATEACEAEVSKMLPSPHVSLPVKGRVDEKLGLDEVGSSAGQEKPDVISGPGQPIVAEQTPAHGLASLDAQEPMDQGNVGEGSDVVKGEHLKGVQTEALEERGPSGIARFEEAMRAQALAGDASFAPSAEASLETALVSTRDYAETALTSQIPKRDESAEVSRRSAYADGMEINTLRASDEAPPFEKEAAPAPAQNLGRDRQRASVPAAFHPQNGASSPAPSQKTLPERLGDVTPNPILSAPTVDFPPDSAKDLPIAEKSFPMGAHERNVDISSHPVSDLSDHKNGPWVENVPRRDVSDTKAAETRRAETHVQGEGQGLLHGEITAGTESFEAKFDDQDVSPRSRTEHEHTMPDRNASPKTVTGSVEGLVPGNGTSTLESFSVQKDLGSQALLTVAEAVSAIADGGQEPRQATNTPSVFALTRPDLPGRLALQIAEVARQLPDKPIEITLSPEELGKVRLSFHISETGALNVVVAAERIETIDLMRRNIDGLISEFSEMGYEGTGFSFQSFDGHPQDQHDAAPAGHGAQVLAEETADARPHGADILRVNMSGSSGMDLRL